MSDFFGIGLATPLDRQDFLVTTGGGATTTAMPRNVWRKPKGTRFTAFYIIGAGAAGGTGWSRAANGDGGGGGGAGSGAIARAIFLNEFLPDELDVFIPGGGVPGGALTAGGRAYICIPGITSFVALNTYLCSGAADASPGGPGAAAAAGTLGAAATIGTVAQSTLANLALSVIWIAGSAGVAGGVHTGAAGAAKTIDNIVNGAPGGAGSTGTDFDGGAVTAAGPFPGLLGGTGAGVNGSHGYDFSSPHMNLPKIWVPGTGGASNNSGTGGKGGDGAIGCGGAGGGAGVTGGLGGNGGPGFGVAVSW